MRIALVDDEPSLLESTRVLLQQCLQEAAIELNLMDCFGSAEDFLQHWKAGSYDIILLDIFMGTQNGVDLARQIRQTDPDVALAFCTSSNAYASESYEVGAGYYLQKPVTRDKLIAMLRRLDLRRIQRNRIIQLPDGFKCLLRQILYTEYSNHTVTFHLQNAAPHSVYMNHAQAVYLLPYRQFCGINKGCIVNFAMVKKLSGSEFLMENGEVLPISRRRLKEVSESYTRYRFERMDEEVG